MDRWLDIFTGVLDIAIGADIRAGTLSRAISNDLADEMAKNLLFGVGLGRLSGGKYQSPPGPVICRRVWYQFLVGRVSDKSMLTCFM
jgi:hypothetical protein